MLKLGRYRSWKKLLDLLKARAILGVSQLEQFRGNLQGCGRDCAAGGLRRRCPDNDMKANMARSLCYDCLDEAEQEVRNRARRTEYGEACEKCGRVETEQPPKEKS